ncbi:MAG: hypothetical protein HY851_04630 [candidate division Zixibacteria bacterium]|nr:hypothetical protein [candidate division Zixibacteria bacterium]
MAIVDGYDSGIQLPTRLILTGKKHDIRVQADGYEPLSYELRCGNADSVSLTFILRTEAPPLIVAESIGLAFLPIQIVLDSAAADQRMKSYANATEMFMVFPFGQGVITKVLGGDTYRKESNVLIISGAVLSVGCFVAGKVLSGHQRSSIRAKNERINRDNNTALLHNREVDRKVQIANRERKIRWDRENKSRGLVNVLKYP